MGKCNRAAPVQIEMLAASPSAGTPVVSIAIPPASYSGPQVQKYDEEDLLLHRVLTSPYVDWRRG